MAVNRKAIVDTIKWIGPFLPKAVELIKANPEIWQSIQDQANRLARRKGTAVQDVLATIEVLRDQVAYLAASADDADESRRAEAWSKRLSHCEHAAQLLTAPGTTKAERAALADRVAALRTEIFTAFIEEHGDDAQGIGRVPDLDEPPRLPGEA
ncbi:hypothetical protein EXU48_11195 [Occultella glacieicola]|uniref:Uncharacterized protein n=1 Tax=Occultella glacieicola TaxID=2518684 RepID=A0ABY2E314_9MICO|nr:hypothetical protein [Occultella glacieicola]TDE94018.1 hypothetical protein EXU48_11195 [Occultella glacieicola]